MRLRHGEPRPVGAERPGVADARVVLEFRRPRRLVVRDVAHDAGLDGGVGRIERALVALVRALPRPAVARIDETDRVIEHHALDDVGELRRKAGRQHSSHRVADDHRLVDLQALQDRTRVARHVVEVVRNDRLRRAAVADLIRHDHPEAFLADRVNHAAEVEPGEVVAVKQDDGVAVRLAERRHVHEFDAHVLTVKRQRQVRGRIRIGDILARDAARLDIRRRGDRGGS